MPIASKPTWGLLPSDIHALLHKREWQNKTRLRKRMLNQLPFPIRVPLKPPSGAQALQQMDHFQQFIAAWQAFTPRYWVQWKIRSFQILREQQIPVFFQLSTLEELLTFLGESTQQTAANWLSRMTPLLTLDSAFYPVLVQHLQTVERLTPEESQQLARILPQLTANMGLERYLRAIPITGIDSKFLEQHQSLLADLLDIWHNAEIQAKGGLLAWLGCLETPKGWLAVRPLCATAQQQMGELSILQLSLETLREQPLPASNILVIENLQSGLALPPLEETIAVFGGGANVDWLDAAWLREKRVAYWGDIDRDGLAILGDARSKCPHLQALMMDEATLQQHLDRMVWAAGSERKPQHLTPAEQSLFQRIERGAYGGNRLEQERLSNNYIYQQILNWLGTLTKSKD